MNTSLLTFDGFPRSDLDVAQIRTTRARIIRLKNDYKSLMAKLESAVQDGFAKGIHDQNAETRHTSSIIQPAAQVAVASTPSMQPPFAKVNTVTPNSPADLAGLRAGDRVTSFGIVNFTNHERLAKVAQVVQQSENVGAIHNYSMSC